MIRDISPAVSEILQENINPLKPYQWYAAIDELGSALILIVLENGNGYIEIDPSSGRIYHETDQILLTACVPIEVTLSISREEVPDGPLS